MNESIEHRHLPGLDLLRFLLSVTILIVHFHFFSSAYIELAKINADMLPFPKILSLHYQFGGLAVETFWMISGVIFFFFYLEVIQEQKMSLFKFTALRFSRLYPLHFLTLFSVAFLQYLYHARFNTTFIYANNDAMHFVLNLFMIGFWNAKFGLSFNGPFWSVSVEIFVYIVFFILAWTGIFKRSLHFFLVALLFFFFYCLGILSPFYDCLYYFFAGCLLARYFQKIGSGWLITCLVVSVSLIALKYNFPRIRGNFYMVRIVDLIIKTGVFTLLIIVFGRLFSRAGNKSVKFLREIGNMTYSVYMIHVTVTIILVLVFYSRGITFFNNGYFFMAYLAGTAALGYLVYRFFELPMQQFLRKKLGKKRSAEASRIDTVSSR